jgi:hypothetical protein
MTPPVGLAGEAELMRIDSSRGRGWRMGKEIMPARLGHTPDPG